MAFMLRYTIFLFIFNRIIKILGGKKGDFPVSENYYQHCISLPMFPTLSNMELEYIVNKIISFYNVPDN